MKSSYGVFRLAGWLLGISGLVWLASSLYADVVIGGQDPTHATSPAFGAVQAVAFVAGTACALALVGHYARGFTAFGKLALTGLVTLFASIVLFGAVSAIGATFVPWLESSAAGRQLLTGDNGPSALFFFFIAATLFQVIGGIAYGIANWRVGNSKIAAGMLIASALLAAPGFILGGPDSSVPAVVSDAPGLLFVLGLAWLGIQAAVGRSFQTGAAPALKPATTGRVA